MNLIKLKTMLFTKATIINRNKGNELYKKGNVINIQGKRIDNIYHLYGKVKDDNKEVRTHIKIDLTKENIISFKCTCPKYQIYLNEGHKYCCPHIVAVSFKFIKSLGNNSTKASRNSDNRAKHIIEKEKKEVFLSVKLHYKAINGIESYEAQFKIGNKNMYLINDLKAFINSIKNNYAIRITNDFIFSNNDFKISKRDLKLLNLLIDKYSDDIFNNKININRNEIGEFIEAIGSKEILFKENFLEYSTYINKGAIPFRVNLKDNDTGLFITPEKNKLKSLDSNNKIFLFKKEIYILDNNKDKLLLDLIDKILKEDSIYLPGNNFNILEVINKLNIFSSKINITDSIRNKIKNSVKIKFNLYKENSNIFCDIAILYGKTKVYILDNKNILNDIRDSRWELSIISFVKSYGFVNDNKRLKFLGSDANLFDILVKKELNLYGDIILGKGFENIKVFDMSNIKINIYEEDSLNKFSYKIEGIDSKTFENSFLSFKENKEFYRDSKGNFINLLDEKLVGFFNLIDTLNLQKDIDINIYNLDKTQLFIFENALESKELDFIKNYKSSEELRKYIDDNDEEVININNSLKLILREYQEEGIKWLRKIVALGFGGILADDMGLGKTLQTISFLSSYENKKTLIIVPTSLVYNWRDEFSKFAPWINISLSVGSIDEREILLNNFEDKDIIITTYGKFKSDIELYKNIKFDFLIIDEGQNIKNHNSQNAKCIKLIDAKHKFVLSGTPIENNLLELWSIFDFIMPSLLYSKEEFKKTFNKDNKGSLENLNTLIKPFILRRTKDEVAKDLPNKYEHRDLVTLSKEQRELYNSYIKAIKDTLENGNNIEVFAALTKLRLACLHPKLLNDEYSLKSDKFIRAHKIINDKLKDGKKILVFSQFTSLLDLFKNELNANGIDSYMITGKTSSKERLSLVNDFNENKNIRVFLISLKAGGVGLNLTSANTVIHFDPWWNPAVENQASDRAHRIGQKNEVDIIKLIAKDTIEEKIVMLQEEKKTLINDILTNNISQNNINKETIQALIDSYI